MLLDSTSFGRGNPDFLRVLQMISILVSNNDFLLLMEESKNSNGVDRLSPIGILFLIGLRRRRATIRSFREEAVSIVEVSSSDVSDTATTRDLGIGCSAMVAADLVSF